MDPSHNNPQYYPPPQQNYPPINPYQSPQQPQGQYLNQTYPPQQGYPQYGQQPQDLNLLKDFNNVNNANNENEFNQGWFVCYKVCLGILILVAFGNLYTGLRDLIWGHLLYGLMGAIGGVCLLSSVVFQFFAMNEKNLQKAKTALVGFGSYLFISCFGPFICRVLDGYGADYFYMLTNAVISVVIYGSLSLIGSYKVYQILNTSNTNDIKTDNYQNYYTA